MPQIIIFLGFLELLFFLFSAKTLHLANGVIIFGLGAMKTSRTRVFHGVLTFLSKQFLVASNFGNQGFHFLGEHRLFLGETAHEFRTFLNCFMLLYWQDSRL